MSVDVIDALRQKPAAVPQRRSYVRGVPSGFHPLNLGRDVNAVTLSEFRHWINEACRIKSKRTPLRHKTDLICQKIRRETGFTRADLVGKSRQAPLVQARFQLYYELASHTRMTLEQIGAFVGGRDHGTVIHGIRQHCKRSQLEAPR